MEINKCTEAEAKKELERIAEESQITGQNVDWTDMEGDDTEDKENPQENEDKDDEE